MLRPFEREIKSPFALLRFGARGATGDFVMIFLMMLLVALGNMVTPIVTGEVMGPITADARTNDLVALLGLMFVVGGAGVAFGFVEAIAGLRVEGRMGNSIQTAVWLKLLDLPMNFFERYVIGDLVNRADGVDSLRSLLSSSLTRTVLHAISGLTSVALLIYYNWKITVAVAGLATIYLAATIPAGFIFLSLKRKIQGLSGQTEGLIFQLLTNQTKIRMAGAEKIAFSRWSELYEEMQHCTYRDRLVNLCLNLIKGVLQTLALAMILLIVGIESGAFQSFFSVPSSLTEINRNPLIRIMPTASFVAFNVAMGQFMGSIFALGETVMTLLTAVPLYQRVKPILEAMPEASDAQRIQLPAIRGRIAFKGVTYRYRESEPNILENFSFHVEPGEMVALVGESGAGKSTVIRLLLAFDSPQKGSILLDDTPLAQLDPKSLRAQFGVVMQDAQLIAGSILENIAGGTNLTEEDAMDAAGLAGLDKDLAGMPMGLQTVVMEGAGTISGGQRQRILIARALARRPSLILFDEATSALDNESQAQVTESIAELAVSRVVIAHRLSTIVASDRICYVGEGRVLEQGTYSELMAINGRFAELARRQLT
ncbi:MAG: ATP-binding cassette domain-containing protein [Candidatus Binatia bacterium]|nr:ATP-binding cassette domain-containing protein [Candidatus Binatia bacterium]